jgi:hypothetical protein
MQRAMRVHKLMPPASAITNPRAKRRGSSSANLRDRSFGDAVSSSEAVSGKEVGRRNILFRYGFSRPCSLRNSKISVTVRFSRAL